MNVKIKVISEGVNFACRGTLVAKNGKRIAEAKLCRPHDCRHVAHEDAERLAIALGHKVVS